MKKLLKRILCVLGAAIVLLIGLAFAKAKLWGRPTEAREAQPARVELSYDEAMADGCITDEEIATHYAPDILAAVNVLLIVLGVVSEVNIIGPVIGLVVMVVLYAILVVQEKKLNGK